MSPPKDVAPPLIYLVDETNSTSTPKAWAEKQVKGIIVVSATKGTCFSWATRAKAAMSTISIWGLVMISKNTHAVFSSINCAVSSMLERSAKRVSMPKRTSDSVSNE